MADLKKVWVTVTPYRDSSWENLKDALARETEWKKDTTLYAYVESVRSCELKRITLAEAEPPKDAWEGCLFDKNCEVRWVQNQDGSFQAWATREVDSEQDGALRVTRADTPRRYYLMGLFYSHDAAQGTALFTEGRYTGKQFCYPVPPGKAQKKDRAYIEVVEYAPVEPTWPEGNMDEIEALLDRPMMPAHRFCGVDVGRDKDV